MARPEEAAEESSANDVPDDEAGTPVALDGRHHDGQGAGGVPRQGDEAGVDPATDAELLYEQAIAHVSAVLDAAPGTRAARTTRR